MDIQAVLTDAMRDGQLVDISRGYDEHPLPGYPVAVSEKWMLLHQVNTDVMTVNGYSAFRTRDVTRAEVYDSFIPQALKFAEQCPIPLSGIRLDSLPELLLDLSEQFPVLAFETEVRWPETCYIGALMETAKLTCTLWTIDTQGDWDPIPEQYRYADITRVQVGDGYTAGLFRVAQGKVPEALSQRLSRFL